MATNAKHIQDDLELEQLKAMVAKTIAETAQINQHVKWYWFVLTATGMLASAAIVKLFF